MSSVLNNAQKEARAMDESTHDRLTPDGEVQNFTVSKLQKFMPKGSSVKVTEAMVDELNAIGDGVDTGLFEEQLLSHTSLLGRGLDMTALARAVKYVILVNIMKLTSEQAYMVVFPTKAQEVIDRGQNCSSFAAMYAQTKAVMGIQKKSILSAKFSMVPTYFRSLEVISNQMEGITAGGAKTSATVQLNAAIALEAALRPEEDTTINLNVNSRTDTKSLQQTVLEQISASIASTRAKLDSGVPLAEATRLGISLNDEDIVEAEIVHE